MAKTWVEFFSEKRREGHKAPEIATMWKTYKEDNANNGLKLRKEKLLGGLSQLAKEHGSAEAVTIPPKPSRQEPPKQQPKDDSDQESPVVVNTKPKPKPQVSAWDKKRKAFTAQHKDLNKHKDDPYDSDGNINEALQKEPTYKVANTFDKTAKLKNQNKKLKAMVQALLPTLDSDSD